MSMSAREKEAAVKKGWEAKWAQRARMLSPGGPQDNVNGALSEDEMENTKAAASAYYGGNPRLHHPSPRTEEQLLHRASERADKSIRTHRSTVNHLLRSGAQNLLLHPTEAQAQVDEALDGEDRHATSCRCKRCYSRDVWGTGDYDSTEQRHSLIRNVASMGGQGTAKRALSGGGGGSMARDPELLTYSNGNGTFSSPTIQVRKTSGGAAAPAHLSSLYRSTSNRTPATATRQQHQHQQELADLKNTYASSPTKPSRASQTSVIVVNLSDGSDSEDTALDEFKNHHLARRRITQETLAKQGEAPLTTSMIRARTARADREEVDSDDLEELKERVTLKQMLRKLGVDDTLDPALNNPSDTTRMTRTGQTRRPRRSIEGEEYGASAYLTTMRNTGGMSSSPMSAQRKVLGYAHTTSSRPATSSLSSQRRNTTESIVEREEAKHTMTRSRQRILADAIRPFSRAVESQDRESGAGISGRDSWRFYLP